MPLVSRVKKMFNYVKLFGIRAIGLTNAASPPKTRTSTWLLHGIFNPSKNRMTLIIVEYLS